MEQYNEQQAEQLAKRVAELEAENAELRKIINPDGKTPIQRAFERQQAKMHDAEEYRKLMESSFAGNPFSSTNNY